MDCASCDVTLPTLPENNVAVLTEYPNGPGHVLLRRILAEVGLEPSFASIVACDPGRRPTSDEINACSGNRRTQLHQVNPTWIILAGGVALHIYRPDLMMSAAHGRPIIRAGRVFFPVIHPAAAERNAEWEAFIRADLRVLAGMIANNDPYLDAPSSCIVCGLAESEMDFPRIDDDGITYCGACFT